MQKKPIGIVMLVSFLVGLAGVSMVATTLKSQGNSSVALEAAFSKSINRIIDERRKNDANGFSCTHFFPEFAEAKEIGPIVEFFLSKGIKPIQLQLNRQFYTSFELSSPILTMLGFAPLRSDDRIVIVLTTESAESEKITAFSVRLIGRTML
jgi:hypothetical protein